MATITPNTTASGAADTISGASEAILEQLEDALVEWSGYVTADDAPRTLREHASPHIKMLRAELGRLHALAASAPAPEPAINPRTQYLTVVYRGVEAGDEARVIFDHPKVSAVSWSHALDDRDAALAAAPKAAPAPVSKSFDEWLEKQFEFRNYYFDLRGPGLMAIPFARRAYEAGRAPVAEDAIALLSEVAHYFTGNDDLPNDLLPRIDALLDAKAAQPEGATP